MGEADKKDVWTHRLGTLELDEPRLMGIVNVTPDSFSDGGLCLGPDAAIAQGVALAAEGAAIIDVGGESTRPGAKPVSASEELARTIPVVLSLAERGLIVSIDTRKPEVAREAVAAGAAIVNDVDGLASEAMREVVASTGAGVCVMHMQGDPETMQSQPSYSSVVDQVRCMLDERAQAGQACGIAKSCIAIDPGIGFGKTLDHNLALLRGIDQLASLGYPVLIGLSRKSFLKTLLGDRDPLERLHGGMAAHLFAVMRGARILRVHDVEATRDALTVWRALSPD
ncbi:MAG: dihydropteroate synthase [Planctomycetota bacterium]|jgi:dihydropteroate synthase